MLAALVSLFAGCPPGGSGLAGIAPATSGTQVELEGTNLVMLAPEGGKCYSGSSTAGGKTTLDWRIDVKDDVLVFMHDEPFDMASRKDTYKAIAGAVDRTYLVDEPDLLEWSWFAKDDPKKTTRYGFLLNFKVGDRVIGFSAPNEEFGSREAAERAISYARTLRPK